MKEKFTIEFGLKKGSTKALWKLISTPHGLAEWMADNVDEDNTGIYTFSWKKSSERAKLLEIQPEERIRFRWMNAPEDTYFEIEIIKSELTGEILWIPLSVRAVNDNNFRKVAQSLPNARVYGKIYCTPAGGYPSC